MRVLTCLLLMSLFFSNVAVATQLVTMNPRLFSKNDDPLEVLRQQDQASKSGAWNYPAANVDGRAIRLPAAALEKQWLFGSMIEASTSAQLRIASGASMKLVRFSMEQGKLVLYECSPNVEVKPGVA